jgi:hypothetical protein
MIARLFDLPGCWIHRRCPPHGYQSQHAERADAQRRPQATDRASLPLRATAETAGAGFCPSTSVPPDLRSAR